MEYFAKTSIVQEILLISPDRTQDQFSQRIYEILNRFGINPNDFPYLISEFSRKEYDGYQAQGNLSASAVDYFLDMIESTLLCKQKLLEFFNFIIHQIKNFDNLTSISNISLYANEILREIRYFSIEDSQEIQSRHRKLLYEDNFAILAAFQALTLYPNTIGNFVPDQFWIYVSYLETLTKNYQKLFDPSLEPQIKVLLRSFFLNDLQVSKIPQLELESLISKLEDCPPSIVPASDFDLFKQVTKSNVIKQAVEIFVIDTLKRKDPPFNTKDEGIQMIYEAFEWIYSSGKVFYFMLHNAHGFSNQGFVFVHKNYQSKSIDEIAFRLLTLLHETFHIYKRFVSDNRSPENSFIIPGEKKRKAEDGFRFNNILIPIHETEIYYNTAIFLAKSSNWNTSVDEFQEKLIAEQNEGRCSDQEVFKFWSSASSISMNYSCIRMKLRKHLSPDSALYWW